METLKNKKYEKFEYLSRYSSVPFYYDTMHEREVYGIGTQLDKNASFVYHELIATDTLDSLALKYYSNPTLWWIIAYFNNITDPFIRLQDRYNTIKIPSLTNIVFKNERN